MANPKTQTMAEATGAKGAQTGAPTPAEGSPEAIELALKERTRLVADEGRLQDALLGQFPDDLADGENATDTAIRLLNELVEARKTADDTGAELAERNGELKAAQDEIGQLRAALKKAGKAEPAPAVKAAPAVRKDVQPLLYRATRDGQWAHRTQGPMKVREGQVFDSRFFDIELMKSCGVPLEKISN